MNSYISATGTNEHCDSFMVEKFYQGLKAMQCSTLTLWFEHTTYKTLNELCNIVKLKF